MGGLRSAPLQRAAIPTSPSAPELEGGGEVAVPDLRIHSLGRTVGGRGLHLRRQQQVVGSAGWAGTNAQDAAALTTARNREGSACRTLAAAASLESMSAAEMRERHSWGRQKRAWAATLQATAVRCAQQGGRTRSTLLKLGLSLAATGLQTRQQAPVPALAPASTFVPASRPAPCFRRAGVSAGSVHRLPPHASTADTFSTLSAPEDEVEGEEDEDKDGGADGLLDAQDGDHNDVEHDHAQHALVKHTHPDLGGAGGSSQHATVSTWRQGGQKQQAGRQEEWKGGPGRQRDAQQLRQGSEAAAQPQLTKPPDW